jgi:2-oxoglutarate ferredoxin oxidoreductase subunit gamma
MRTRYEVRFAGSGGQGNILAAFVTAQAAAIYEKGLYVAQTQAYGAEARGGKSQAQVIISTEEIDYPKVIAPNLQIILTQQACEYVDDTITGGRVVCDDYYVHTLPRVDANLYYLPIVRTAREKLGREIVTNMVALGCVARVLELDNILSPEAVKKAILDTVPKGTEELNTKAFEEGYNMFRDSLHL